jgi:subtilase family serine protease
MARLRRSHDVIAKPRRQGRTLRMEELEVRCLLTATATAHTDYVELASSTGITGYTPAQIRAAYGFNSLSFGSTAANGAGQTIAIIDAYNDPNIQSDLATFDAAFGIAAPPSFKVVNQSGGSTLPKADTTGGWEGEIALDVEWAHAIAPGANIILVEANSASDADLFAAVNWARQQAAVSVISMSWGSDDSLANAANDKSLSSQYLVTPSGHQGITFVASSGDDGHANFPAESPNVLAVGGTDLYLTSSGSITSETAWTPTTSGGQTWSGGGGVSQEFSGRNVPDVSYNAGVGMAVYDSYGSTGGWASIGGTSAGAPQWAALVAIANQGRALAGQSTLNGASQTLAAIYAAPSSDFHDITTGSTQFESAGVGYDLATGRGSPIANLLVPFLVSYGSSSSSGSGGSTGGTTSSNPTAPTNFTASTLSTTQISLSWTASSGETGYRLYENVNGTPVLLTTYGASATSAVVSGLTAGTTYSFELVAYNSSGTAATSWVQATTAATTVTTVVAPQNLTATATSSTSVHLSWSASAGATGYRVYEYQNGQAVLVSTLGTGATATTISGLTPGSIQYFFVTAYNANSSASTSWVSAILPSSTTTATVTAPKNVTAQATSSTAAQISWSAVTGATGYRIYELVSGAAVQVGATTSATSLTVSNLTPGTTDYFYVTAYNSTSAASSGWVSVVMPSAATLSAPSAVATSTSSTTGTLSWSASAAATGYEIVYWNGFQAVLLGTVGAGTTSVSISGLTAGATTYFAVIAYNSTTSAASNWAALTTPSASAARLADIFFAQAATAKHQTDWLL